MLAGDQLEELAGLDFLKFIYSEDFIFIVNNL